MNQKQNTRNISIAKKIVKIVSIFNFFRFSLSFIPNQYSLNVI